MKGCCSSCMSKVYIPQLFSSEKSQQSTTPSHIFLVKYCALRNSAQVQFFSSEPSIQSTKLLHLDKELMHSPLPHFMFMFPKQSEI